MSRSMPDRAEGVSLRVKVGYLHSGRVVQVVLMCFGCCTLSAAQNINSPGRDPRAITVLNSCLEKTGGTGAITTVQDISATGNITYYWGAQEVDGEASIRARGLDQFRLDASLPEGKTSWIVNRGQGTLEKADGTVRKSAMNNSLVTGAVTFPEAKVPFFLNDPRIALQYGLSTVNGAAAYRIQIRLPVRSDRGSTAISNQPGLLDMFFEVNTCHLVKTQDVFYPTTSTQDHYVHELFFGDFRAIQGRLLPHVIIERFAGQTTWMLRLQSISLNTGIQNSEFELEQ